MKDWEKYWKIFPVDIDEQDFLRQVGKTVNNIPISKEQFDEILKSIRINLDLNPDDDVLDLCCGNGFITKSISENAGRVTGIDFSSKLIEVAGKYNSSKNIEYIYGNILDVRHLVKDKKINKGYMYEALQHFDVKQFESLLQQLKGLMKGHFIFFFGSVPDMDRKWKFYNTIRRKLSYVWRVINNNEAIGTWWDKGVIERVCAKNNLRVRFIEQNSKLHTAHYRFDMVIYE